MGCASVTRDSAGVYSLVLDDKYNRLVCFDVSLEAASAEDLVFQVLSEDVSGSTKTIQFVCKAAAVATDPSDGSSLRVSVGLSNSSVAR